MFTGIITGVGRIVAVHDLGASPEFGKRVGVEAPAGYIDDVNLGDSIALDGACMTVAALDAAHNRFSVDVSAESLTRTRGFDDQSRINLEKALRAGDRLGGHIVSGHVDGVGQVTRFEPTGESWLLVVQVPAALARFLAYKGSVTVNGVSLTVNRVSDAAGPESEGSEGSEGRERTEYSGGSEIVINLIPHTARNTALGDLCVGARVNLEIDTVARYVERMLQAGMSAPVHAAAAAAATHSNAGSPLS